MAGEPPVWLPGLIAYDSGFRKSIMDAPEKSPSVSQGQRSWFQRTGYRAVQGFAWCLCKLMFGVRKTGFENMPEQGAVLVCGNHQSNLDPILVGCLVRRPMNFLAKKSLFKYPPLSWLIRFLDSIPLSKDGLSAEGIKETLRRLKRNEAVLMFPEGARTFTGKMMPLLPGFAAIVKRTRPTLVPIGISGAFRAWPRTRLFPIPGPRIRCVMGLPIRPEEYAGLNDAELTALLAERIRQCVGQAQEQLGLPNDP